MPVKCLKFSKLKSAAVNVWVIEPSPVLWNHLHSKLHYIRPHHMTICPVCDVDLCDVSLYHFTSFAGKLITSAHITWPHCRFRMWCGFMWLVSCHFTTCAGKASSRHYTSHMTIGAVCDVDLCGVFVISRRSASLFRPGTDRGPMTQTLLLRFSLGALGELYEHLKH